MAEFYINEHRGKMLAENGYIYERRNKRKSNISKENQTNSFY